MLPLKVFRNTVRGVPDLLNWAALIGDGVVLGKDGSLLGGFWYRGDDIASSTEVERYNLTARVNAALSRFGDGWALWADAVRMPASAYPPREASHFPDPISRLIDEERRAQFMSEAAHFECEYALLLSYLPPLRRNRRVLDLMYSGEAVEQTPADRILASYEAQLLQLEDALGSVIKLRRMRSFRRANGRRQDELVNYLHGCLVGEPGGVDIPKCGMYLDAIVGGRELWVGDRLRLGGKYVAMVAVEGFPAESFPVMLDVLDYLSMPYRWSTRFIFLDHRQARADLNKMRRKWKQKERGFVAQLLRQQNAPRDEDAQQMTQEAEAALAQANSGLVAYGYYTPTIVLMSENVADLAEMAREVVRQVEREGFACRVETLNTLEAYLGSLPGHTVPNVRRPPMHTKNLADLMALGSVWPGQEFNPCPYYPPRSPPLLYAATSGATPFRFNLHVGDVGHQLIFGPIGSGKSTLLAMIFAQFRRYPGSVIWAFDKGLSLYTVGTACGARHYEIGADAGKVSFCPLGQLATGNDVAWAEEWIGTCYHLQAGKPLSPGQVHEVHRALGLLQERQRADQRSLTDFVHTVQDVEVREALNKYTMDGSFGHLLDARVDGLVGCDMQIFEMEDLLQLGDGAVIPVLLYLFRRFHKALTGAPSLLQLDEAWVMLGHPVFREKIREWLKVLRKANCAVVLATQSLSDAARSGIIDVLQESCGSKVFLPNEEANKGGLEGFAGPRDLYGGFGLNETELGLLERGVKKREYYYYSREGRRVFDLGLGPLALAFVGVSDKDQLGRVRELQRQFGDEWPYRWLDSKGVDYARYERQAHHSKRGVRYRDGTVAV